MTIHYTITSRVSLKNGVLQEEILHVPVPADPTPWSKYALRALLCLGLLYYAGAFDELPISARLLQLLVWCYVVFTCFVVLYRVLGDCQYSNHRK